MCCQVYFFGELCVPGMIATNLLCALHFTFTFQDGCWMESQASTPYPQDWPSILGGDPAHRWPGVRRSGKLCCQQLGVWGQPTDMLSGWQWHDALTCPLGSLCGTVVSSFPLCWWSRCWWTCPVLATARRGGQFDPFWPFLLMTMV